MVVLHRQPGTTPNDAARLRRRTLLLGAAGLSCFGAANAQQGKVVTVVVPQPAGNPSDVFARKLLPIMQRELDQTVVVENVPGAGGGIGVQRVLNSPPDGSNLLFVSQTEPILTPLAVAAARYKPQALRPIGVIGRTSYILVGRPDLPATNLAELLAYGRRMKDRPMSCGHIGSGSMIHLLGAQWSKLSGVPILPVSYRGVPPMQQDLMGGQIDITFIPLGGNSLPLLEAGKVRVYGSTSRQDIALLPGVAPLSRQDPVFHEFVYGAWGSMMAPRAVPMPALQRLHKAFATAMRDPDVLAFVRNNGTDPHPPQSLDDLDKFYNAEIVTYQALARSIGVVPE